MNQARKITGKQLVLQRLGGRGHQHALTAEQGRHQISVGLANTRAGLHHQHPALLYGLSHRQRHAGLAWARRECGLSQRERTLLCKHLRDRLLQMSQNRFTFQQAKSAQAHIRSQIFAEAQPPPDKM